MRWFLGMGLALFLSQSANAGELIFVNGSRLAGELSNETLMLSTGSGLLEVAPDDVAVLSSGEIRLRDGRVIRGTLVGGQIKARTALGEISVTIDELQSYRAGTPSGSAGPASGTATGSTMPVPAAAPASLPIAGSAISSGLPTMSAYQDGAPSRQGGVQAVSLTRESPVRVLEAVGVSALYREALLSSPQVGRLAAGQQVRYVDSIDRRLRILNLLVFDGGYWIKVRLADGAEGWVPADTVREVR